MAKLNLPQRAQRFADQFIDSPDVTKRDAARYGFSQGFRAHQRDVRTKMIDDRHELARRFYFLSKHGLWEKYLAEKDNGDYEFVHGIKSPTRET